jgi:hypothetical protein
MKKPYGPRIATLAMGALACLLSASTSADDIDIFVGASAGATQTPNVLVVLDNTSNWARQSQQWPGGLQQGQSEVRALSTAINAARSGSLNLGIMEFVTEGNANQQGGFIRYAVRNMDLTNKASVTSTLNTIFGAVTSPTEKRNSNTPYGDLMYDVYNYFAGVGVSNDGSNTSASLNPPNPSVDAAGYTTTYSRFSSPLSSSNSCAHNFIIFISNPNASGPATDTAANTAALAALGGNTNQLGLPNFTTSTTPTTTALGTTTACYSSAALCTSAGVASFAPGLVPTCSDTSAYPGGCTCGATVAGSPTCGAGTQRYSVIGTQNANTTVTSATSVDCYTSAGTTFPTTTKPDAAWPTTTGGNKETFTSCPAGQTLWFTGSTKITANGSCKNKYTYSLACKTNAATTTNLGYTSACYGSAATCATTDYSATCATYSGGCACGNPTTTTGTTCPGGQSLYSVLGNSTIVTTTPTGTYSTDTAPFNADEWARFLFQGGVPVAGVANNPSIVTYTIDVYNAQQNAQHTSLMMSMAKNGGGKYFAAKNENDIVTALRLILAEIQSVNSTFASASLPVNATNRTQNANQVFIGMFRPDPDAFPRWYGNLKQYQIGNVNGALDLVDVYQQPVTNLQTGFVVDCAASFWTSDSPTPSTWGNSYYWIGIYDNPVPKSNCKIPLANGTLYSRYGDKPDGPFVEKGAVAEVLRKGNRPPYADGDSTTPTWTVNRNLYTLSGGSSLAALDATAMPSLSTSVLRFSQGYDVNGDTYGSPGGTTTLLTRPSIHGDVVHSRPLPINYGTEANPNAGVVVYYGANDGMFRAVDSSNGKELWAFMAPESGTTAAGRCAVAAPALECPVAATNDPLTRLATNSPLINYPNVDPALNPLAKDYFFDGSTGIFQDKDNLNIWIYPTMRRGGRMVYAFDVTDRNLPKFKWRKGCPNLTNDAGCSSGFSGIGQTWSTPNVAPVQVSASSSVTALFFGGGYDSCEDTDVVSPVCVGQKGTGVYIVDAFTGNLLTAAPLPTLKPVAADVALIDINGDGYVDYAYVADVGGNIYRVNLVDRSVAANGTVTYAPLAASSWTITRVASTTGAGRKFLFAPELLASANKVYIGIGSGDREHPLAANYPYANVLNRFYVYLDDPSRTSAISLDADLVDYTNQSVVASIIAANGNSCTATTAFTNTKYGWRIDLNQFGQGEQTVTSAVIVGGMVTFSTNRPIPTASGQCSTILGEARGYFLNLLNASGAISPSCYINGTYQASQTCTCGGTRSATFAGGGLPPSPVIGTVPVNGVPQTVVIGAVQRGGGGSSPIAPQQVNPPIQSKRKNVYRYTTGTDNK